MKLFKYATLSKLFLGASFVYGTSHVQPENDSFDINAVQEEENQVDVSLLSEDRHLLDVRDELDEFKQTTIDTLVRFIKRDVYGSDSSVVQIPLPIDPNKFMDSQNIKLETISENATFLEMLFAVRETFKRLKEERDKLVDIKTKLITDTASLNVSFETEVQAKHKALARLEDLKRQSQGLEGDLTTIQSKLEDKKRELVEANISIQNLENSFQNLTENSRASDMNAQSTIEDTYKELRRLNNHVTSLNSQMNDLTKEKNELETKHSKLRSIIEGIKDRFIKGMRDDMDKMNRM